MIKKSINLILSELSQMFDSESVKIGLSQIDLNYPRRLRKHSRKIASRRIVHRKSNSVPDNFFLPPERHSTRLRTSVAG